MNEYATMNVSIHPDYGITQLSVPMIPMHQGLEKVDMQKDSSGRKEYLITSLVAGIYALTLLVGTITIKTKINKLEITLANTLANHSQRMETALYHIVDNLPSERISVERRAEIRKNLEYILKQKK
ncbi:MAG: hypothetical protein AABX33_03045 [Nanoarchaeota archaeon]